MHHTNDIATGKRNVPQTVPGNSSFFSVTKYSKAVCVIGDSHLNRIKKNLFKSSLANVKAYLSVFRGSTIKRIKHFVAPTLVEDKPDVIIILVGCNDVTKQKMDTADPNKLADDIIDIAKLCTSYGVKDIIVLSVLPKRNISLTRIIRELNDQFKTNCQLNNFGFICNDNVTSNYLWKDGIHFTDKGTNILAGNFVNFLNYFVLNRNDNIDSNMI